MKNLLHPLLYTALYLLATAAVATAATEAVTVFMCADSGEYSGMHELGFLQKALEQKEAIALPHCRSAYTGYLRHADGHAIRSMTITTGIGYVSAVLCTQSLLEFRRAQQLELKQIVYIGTSGFSPLLGGWDPSNTTGYVQWSSQEYESLIIPTPGESSSASPAGDSTAAPPLVKTYKTFLEEQKAVKNSELQRRPAPSHLNFEMKASGDQLDADGCSPLTEKTATPLAVGSICVTSAAFMMESGQCTDYLRSNQCSRPNCGGFHYSLGKEPKLYISSDAFAKEIEAASYGKEWPAMPAFVQEGLQKYWAANEAFVKPAGFQAPTTPSFVRCAEGTVNAINVGAERDYLCREYTASTLNRLHRRFHASAEEAATTYNHSIPYTARDVVCVQAMEAFGFLRAINDDAAATEIPVAVLRTASNYDMFPLKKVYLSPSATAQALHEHASRIGADVTRVMENDEAAADMAAYKWHQDIDFMSAADYDAFVIASFQYSVKTVTFVLSNYFFGGKTFS